MKRLLFTVGALCCALLGLAAPAQAGEFYDNPNVVIDLDAGVYHHEYNVTFTCGADGTVTFSGNGKARDNDGESISGTVDTVARTFVLSAAYVRSDNFTWQAGGSIAPTGNAGNVALSGTWNGFTLSGFFVLPDCAPAPVPGNHGQYVSGAAKAGVKGKALADIAKNGALVGPYPG